MNINDIKNKLDGHSPKIIGVTHEFAILILMTEIEGQPCFVFEKRAEGINQPGDYCFPGGFIEEGESVFETALRETHEELGIEEKDITLFGQFDSIYNGKRAIHSIAGYVDSKVLEKAIIDKNEVEQLVTVPVSHFTTENLTEVSMSQPLDTSDFPYEKYGINPKYRWYEPERKVVIYEPYEGHTIWGLTAMFIRTLLG